jgi:DNA invertase Pin-like site-specific DNA recombinase
MQTAEIQPAPQRRRPGAPAGNTNAKIGPTRDQAEQILALAGQGMSLRQIARALSIGRTTLHRWGRQHPAFRRVLDRALRLAVEHNHRHGRHA